MITKTTACGRTLLFSDCDSDIVNGLSFYYDKTLQSVRYYNLHTRTFRMLMPLLFGASKENKSKYGYLYADGNRFNFQRENITRVTKAEFYKKRPPVIGHKYKGVSYKNGKAYVEVWVGSKGSTRYQLRFLVTSGQFTVTEEYAAGVYNALLDYIGRDGYRNDVPKVELTEKQKRRIDEKLVRWGMKCV